MQVSVCDLISMTFHKHLLSLDNLFFYYVTLFFRCCLSGGSPFLSLQC